MKARVKATGEIVEVIAIDGDWLFCSDGAHYGTESLEGIESEIDYWTKLEHQYAGMAMQGMMAHTNIDYDEIVDLCVEVAHTIVEKLKEKEERK